MKCYTCDETIDGKAFPVVDTQDKMAWDVKVNKTEIGFLCIECMKDELFEGRDNPTVDDLLDYINTKDGN